MYETQGMNDCAIVSIANYCGCTKEDVFKIGEQFISGDFRVKVRLRGTNHDEILLICAMILKRPLRISTPRRGQEKLTGLLSWHRAGRKSGHMTACVDGNVFDTDGSIYPIETYRIRFGYSLRKVWS